MKTLHYSIIVISLILIGVSNFSTAHVEIPQISTSKSNFTDGDTIPIDGYASPNSTTNIFLLNNHGNIQNSTQVKSNNTGYFNTNLGIPSHVIGGAWTLFAISGDSNFAMQLMVNFHGSNTPPFHSLGGLPPLKQFKLGIKPVYIQCRSDLQVIIKSEDGSPACVKPDTSKILIERGWTKSITSGISQTSRTSNQTVEIVSIQSVSSLTNPGGPPIQLTLRNIGTTPITSLKALLTLNNDYNFDFENVTQVNPLASGDSISETRILIGAGFRTDIVHPITISGITNNIPFTYTENIHMP